MIQSTNYITLVGSRKAPDFILPIAEEIGYRLSQRGWIGRSGGAIGMDQAFMNRYHPDRSIIYRPDDKLFRGRCININDLEQNIIDECLRIIKTIIPWYDDLDDYSRMLHARNVLQVLGEDLSTPSRAVLYWAPESRHGVVSGGTRTAVMLARKCGIPTSNLKNESDLTRWARTLGIDYKPNKNYGLSFME